MEIRSRVCQAKGTASAMALRWEHAWCVRAQLQAVMNERKVGGRETKEGSWAALGCLPTMLTCFTSFLSSSPQPWEVDTVSENHLQMRLLQGAPLSLRSCYTLPC